MKKNFGLYLFEDEMTRIRKTQGDMTNEQLGEKLIDMALKLELTPQERFDLNEMQKFQFRADDKKLKELKKMSKKLNYSMKEMMMIALAKL